METAVGLAVLFGAISYLFACAVAADAAGLRGKSAVLWFLLALVATPVIALLCPHRQSTRRSGPA